MANHSQPFFNEVNRARPQVHSLMLRAMAERSVTAFNKTASHLQVFADRNRIEKEETFGNLFCCERPVSNGNF